MTVEQWKTASVVRRLWYCFTTDGEYQLDNLIEATIGIFRGLLKLFRSLLVFLLFPIVVSVHCIMINKIATEESGNWAGLRKRLFRR